MPFRRNLGLVSNFRPKVCVITQAPSETVFFRANANIASSNNNKPRHESHRIDFVPIENIYANLMFGAQVLATHPLVWDVCGKERPKALMRRSASDWISMGLFRDFHQTILGRRVCCLLSEEASVRIYTFERRKDRRHHNYIWTLIYALDFRSMECVNIPYYVYRIYESFCPLASWKISRDRAPQKIN